MLTNGMTQYTGVASVIHALENQQAKRWVVSPHYKDQDIKNVRSVNYAGSKHRTKHN